MIQYPITLEDLNTLIEAEKPGWLIRAEERTEGFESQGFYEESSSIWSEVKVVYMRLQHSKCAYCERQLESEEEGRVEHDLEHFRPKKKARPWRLTRALEAEGITLTRPLERRSDPGYHLLAYHPLNYCTSCKPCNSTLKRDYFPIEGVRVSDGADPVELDLEMPLLVNPVGEFDTDPAELITFFGLSPMPRQADGYERRRALISIAFFKLDDRRRKYLFRQRAQVIVDVRSYQRLAELEETEESRQVYADLVQVLIAPSSPHTNCARSYHALYMADREEAEELFVLAAAYLRSISA